MVSFSDNSSPIWPIPKIQIMAISDCVKMHLLSSLVFRLFVLVHILYRLEVFMKSPLRISQQIGIGLVVILLLAS